jgi:hypothetical protein
MEWYSGGKRLVKKKPAGYTVNRMLSGAFWCRNSKSLSEHLLLGRSIRRMLRL